MSGFLSPPLESSMIVPSSPSASVPLSPPPGFEIQRPSYHEQIFPISPADPSSPQTATNPSTSMSPTPPSSTKSLILAPTIDASSVVNLLVEENGIVYRFPVHRALLIGWSSWFKRLLEEDSLSLEFRRGSVTTMKMKFPNKQSSSSSAVVTTSTSSTSAVAETETETVPKFGDEFDFDKETRNESSLFFPGIQIQGGEAEAVIEKDVEVRVLLPETVPNIVLPRDIAPSVSAVAAFIDWLYLNPTPYLLPHSPYTHPTLGLSSGALIQLWVFCSRIDVKPCSNFCIEALEFLSSSPAPPTPSRNPHRHPSQPHGGGKIEIGTLGWIYENTKGDNGLKRLLVDQVAWRLDGKWLVSQETEGLFPREFLRDLCMRLVEVGRIEVAAPFEIGRERMARYWS